MLGSTIELCHCYVAVESWQCLAAHCCSCCRRTCICGGWDRAPPFLCRVGRPVCCSHSIPGCTPSTQAAHTAVSGWQAGYDSNRSWSFSLSPTSRGYSFTLRARWAARTVTQPTNSLRILARTAYSRFEIAVKGGAASFLFTGFSMALARILRTFTACSSYLLFGFLQSLSCWCRVAKAFYWLLEPRDPNLCANQGLNNYQQATVSRSIGSAGC